MLRYTSEHEYPWMLRDASLAPFVPSMIGPKFAINVATLHGDLQLKARRDIEGASHSLMCLDPRFCRKLLSSVPQEQQWFSSLADDGGGGEGHVAADCRGGDGGGGGGRELE
mmetsp:Transcript_11473/g.37713  ORF Transcript_11473/g.37713 Transcript_11473/m.37713 type:complete len:112 (-) Transcript_11473:113-448(-)